jgi:hypothetical protein
MFVATKLNIPKTKIISPILTSVDSQRYPYDHLAPKNIDIIWTLFCKLHLREYNDAFDMEKRKKLLRSPSFLYPFFIAGTNLVPNCDNDPFEGGPLSFVLSV